MPTVPWHELGGERAEHFISILLLREFPDGHRRRATQGDGGVDVIVPVSDNPPIVDVYQIKKFHEPITRDNKSKIKKSIKSLLETVETEQLHVRKWHLTLPVDGSEPDQKWMRDQFTSTEIVPRWKGREFLEGLCAKHRDVVDYYILGGQERLHELVRLAMQMQVPGELDQGEGGLSIESVHRNLEPVFLKLNADDPHYRYNLSMIHEEDIDFHSAPPNAVMSQFMGAADEPILRVDVYPRYRHAVEDRPITSTVRFDIPEDANQAAEALRNFSIYGDNLEMPAEFASVEINDPLSGPVESQPMNVRIWTPEPASLRRVRLIVSESDGTRVASAFFNVLRLSQGTSGLGFVAVLESDSGLITLTQRSAGPGAPGDDAGMTNFNFSISWAHKIAAAVIEDMRFMRTMLSPRKLVLAQEFTGPIIDMMSFDGHTESVISDGLLSYAVALNDLQEYADGPLRLVPAETDEELRRANDAVRISSLLYGRIIGNSSPLMGVQLTGTDLTEAVDHINASGKLRVEQPLNAVVANGRVAIPDAVFSFDDVSAAVGAVEGVEQVILTPRSAEFVEARVWLRRFE